MVKALAQANIPLSAMKQTYPIRCASALYTSIPSDGCASCCFVLFGSVTSQQCYVFAHICCCTVT